MRVQKCKGNLRPVDRTNAAFPPYEDCFRDSCVKWGYQEVRTPTIEYLHLFTSTGTLTPALWGRCTRSWIGTAGAVKEFGSDRKAPSPPSGFTRRTRR